MIMYFVAKIYVCIHISSNISSKSAQHIKNSPVCIHHKYFDFNDESKVIS